jgi:hypothetical protein
MLQPPQPPQPPQQPQQPQQPQPLKIAKTTIPTIRSQGQKAGLTTDHHQAQRGAVPVKIPTHRGKLPPNLMHLSLAKSACP